MSAAEKPLTEIEDLQAKLLALVAENERLKADNKWLERILMGAGVVLLILLAWLLVSLGVFDAKDEPRAEKRPREGSLAPLFGLMQRLFNAEEVEWFIHLHFGGEGLEVWQSLSSARSEGDLIVKVLHALRRRGLVNVLFFDAMVAVRPHQEASIRQVQREYLADGEPTQVNPLATDPSSA